MLQKVKHDSPALRRFNQIRQEVSGSLIIEIVSDEMLSIREPYGENVFIEIKEIDQLVEALQAFKAAREYDQLAEKKAEKLKRWQGQVKGEADKARME